MTNINLTDLYKEAIVDFVKVHEEFWTCYGKLMQSKSGQAPNVSTGYRISITT